MNKKALAITVGALGAVGVTMLLLNMNQHSHEAVSKTVYVHMPADIRGKDAQGMSLSQVVNTYGQTEQKRS